MNVLVTGATGFIGRRLVAELLSQGERVSIVTRDADKARGLWPVGTVVVHPADLARGDPLAPACRGAQVIFHLAGYAHAVDEEDSLAEGRHEAVTVQGTRALLRDALEAGVRRIVYASSVKAMGEGGDDCLDENGTAVPLTAYGRSRLKAESLLLDAARADELFQAVIVRFPLVYGRENQGNLIRMIAAIDRGRFPPLPPLRNRRSMIWVGDAVQALLLAARKPEAAGRTYIATDGRDYSTDEIYAAMRAALGKRRAAWRVPMSALRLLARAGDVIGRLRGRPWVFDSVALGKLTGSACYRAERIVRELGFEPRRVLADVLPEMVDEYRSRL